MSFWVVQFLNAMSLGMLLFMLAAGLTMIFGLMRLINLAHGSFYLLGAYIGLTIMAQVGNFFVAVIASGAAMGVLGMAIHRWLLQQVQREHLSQVLLTFGLLFLLGDLALWIWGPKPKTIDLPEFLAGTSVFGAISYPTVRLAIIVIGLGIAAFLWWFQERTQWGARVRASVDDIDMAKSIGINVPRVMTLVFGIGAFLAGISGALGASVLGVFPGVDFEVLVLAFIVVILGGLGSLKGAFIAALLIGFLNNIGKTLFPEFSMFILFAPMPIILVIKPTGLFGRI